MRSVSDNKNAKNLNLGFQYIKYNQSMEINIYYS